MSRSNFTFFGMTTTRQAGGYRSMPDSRKVDNTNVADRAVADAVQNISIVSSQIIDNVLVYMHNQGFMRIVQMITDYLLLSLTAYIVVDQYNSRRCVCAPSDTATPALLARTDMHSLLYAFIGLVSFHIVGQLWMMVYHRTYRSEPAHHELRQYVFSYTLACIFAAAHLSPSVGTLLPLICILFVVHFWWHTVTYILVHGTSAMHGFAVGATADK